MWPRYIWRSAICRSFPSLANAVGPDGFRQALSGRIHIGPEIDYLEKAFDATKYGEISSAPYLDVTIPTLLDPSLAPAGKHVMSDLLSVCAVPVEERELEGPARGTGQQRDQNAGGLFAEFGEFGGSGARDHAADLEETYGYTGGHIFHGELALDQIFTMRPVLDWARYQTPVKGLFLCGNGTHPGNGLTGACGANAVKEIIHELR